MISDGSLIPQTLCLVSRHAECVGSHDRDAQPGGDTLKAFCYTYSYEN